jgi:hypothetical protein
MYVWNPVQVKFQFITYSFVSSTSGYTGFLWQPSHGFQGTAKHSIQHFVQSVICKQCWSAATWCICLDPVSWNLLSNCWTVFQCGTALVKSRSDNWVFTSVVYHPSQNTHSIRKTRSSRDNIIIGNWLTKYRTDYWQVVFCLAHNLPVLPVVHDHNASVARSYITT